MRWGTFLGASAAAGLMATAASAAPQTVTFDGSIIDNASQASTTYVASYVYDPTQSDVTTTAEQGGLVTTSYAGPVQATITFGGASYVIDDTDMPGDVIKSVETLAQPPSVEYIADANSGAGSLTNLIEVRGDSVDSAFGSYTQISDGAVTNTYTLVPGSVSATPEPSTWALMFAGLGGVGLMLRRAQMIAGFRSRDALAA